MDPSPDHIQISHTMNIMVVGVSRREVSNGSRSSTVKKIVWVIAFLCSILLLKSIVLTVSEAVTLLLTTALLVIRLLQFTKYGDGFNQVIQLKYLINSWIFIITLCSALLTFIPDIPILNLPLLDSSLILGVYALTCALPAITHRLLPRIQLDKHESGINVPEAVSEILNCLIFWLLETKLLKLFEDEQILKLSVEIWIEKLIVAIIVYNSIRLFIYGIVWLLKKACEALDPGTRANPHWYLLLLDNLLYRRYVVYCANGMRTNIIFIFSSMMLLLIWVNYFRKHLEKTEIAKRVLEIGTWTFVSLLICSLLWLTKTCILLGWEANVVYERLESQILESRKQLYFLGLLGRHEYDIFNLLYHDNSPSNVFLKFLRSFFEVATPDIKYRSKTDKEDCWGEGELNLSAVKKFLTQKKTVVKDDLLMPNGCTPTMHDLKVVTQYLLTAKGALSTKNYASDILHYLKSHSPSPDDHWVRVEHLKQLIIAKNNMNDGAASDSKDESSSEGIVESGNNVQSSSIENERNVQPSDEETDSSDWKCFEEMLSNADVIGLTSNSGGFDAQNSNLDHAASLEEVISFKKIQMWMEMAQKSCAFVANAVSSGTELVDCLNTIMSGAIIVITFIMWLLLTKLATTKLLVIIASPILAASFIFGDTCKNLFHSIIFVYVLHPFDVGHLCDIDVDQKMEVKSVGVWKTTFSKTDEAGNQVEVIYPNSELANKKIINYKDCPNLHHFVRRSVTSTIRRPVERAQSMANNNL